MERLLRAVALREFCRGRRSVYVLFNLYQEGEENDQMVTPAGSCPAGSQAAGALGASENLC